MAEKRMTLKTQLEMQEEHFEERNSAGLNFKKECEFAYQSLRANDYLMNVASKQKNSLWAAIVNVAAIGISLNPALKHAYLVPRDSKVCLDISYRGLRKLAIEAGAIDLCVTELVYEGDEWKWRGSFDRPLHEFDPMDDTRINPSDIWQGLRGGYCVARLPDGTFLVSHTTVAQLRKVMSVSKGSAKPHSPWQQWPEEMIRKTLIRRASKEWPETARVAEAIRVLDESDKTNPSEAAEELFGPTAEQTAQLREALEKSGLSEEEFYATAGVKEMHEIPPARIPRILKFLEEAA